MIHPTTPSGDGAQTVDESTEPGTPSLPLGESTSERSRAGFRRGEHRPRSVEDLDPPTGEPDDPRHGYEPL